MSLLGDAASHRDETSTLSLTTGLALRSACIYPCSSVGDIDPSAPSERVVVVVSEHLISPSFPFYGVASRAANQMTIASSSTSDQVVAVFTVHVMVATRTALECVISSAGIQDVMTTTTLQCVVPGTRIDRVLAIAAAELPEALAE
jgi:hypothetical protein